MPRIPPVDPPYTPEIAEFLAKWMPPGADAEPLRLFRTLAVHPDLSSRMRPLGAGILGHGLVDPREREIVLLRTCARAGAEYEWGVHVTGFASAVGLTGEQAAATATSGPEDPVWSDRERTLLALADELHDTARVTETTWEQLDSGWTPEQILELVAIAGWYRLLAGIINVAGVEHEPWAARYTK